MSVLNSCAALYGTSSASRCASRCPPARVPPAEFGTRATTDNLQRTACQRTKPSVEHGRTRTDEAARSWQDFPRREAARQKTNLLLSSEQQTKRRPCRHKEFKRNLQTAVVCWTLDVRTFGRSDVRTFERSDTGRWTLALYVDVGSFTLDIGSWTLNAGWSLCCWTLFDVVERCWTLLAVVGSCWPLLAVVGRSDVRTFRRWTFGGWTSDVGMIEVAC